MSTNSTFKSHPLPKYDLPTKTHNSSFATYGTLNSDEATMNHVNGDDGHRDGIFSNTFVPSKSGQFFESFHPTFQTQKRNILNAWNQSSSKICDFNPFLSQYSNKFPRFTSFNASVDNNSLLENEELGKEAAHNPLRLIKLQLFIRHGPRTYKTSLPNYERVYGTLPWKCPPYVTEYLQNHHFFKSDLVKSQQQESTMNLSFNIYYKDDENHLLGNCGLGQLTEIGWNYMERVGSFLRYRYGRVDPNDAFVRTTDSHPRRTEDTTKAVLMGWMPEINSWNIYRVEPMMEYFYYRESHCPRIKYLMNEFRNSEMILEEYNRVKEYIEPSIRRALKINDSTKLPSVRLLHNTFDCLLSDGKSIHLTEKELNDVEEHSVWYYRERYSIKNRIIGRLSISRVFDLLIQNIDARIAREQNVDPIDGKLYFNSIIGKNRKGTKPYISRNINSAPCNVSTEIFVGHDQTLLPMLSVLNQKFLRWPGFGSWIAFETFYDVSKEDYFIRVLWDGVLLDLSKDLVGRDTPMQPITEYPELRHLYRYEDFRNWCLRDVIFDSYKNACKVDLNEKLFEL